MSIKVALHHVNQYDYDRPVQLAPHWIRLRPAPHTRTPLHHYSLKVLPAKHFINWQQDPFGNYIARIVFPEKATQMRVEVDVIAELVKINPFEFFVEPYADQWPFSYDWQLHKELMPYFEITEAGPLLLEWMKQTKGLKGNIVDIIVQLNQQLQKDIAYVIRMEPGVQKCEETLGLAKGSCRDSAWLMVQIFRHMGLAARFVSGYLVQLAQDEKSLDGPSGPPTDFTDLHAWTEVFIPGGGWIGLDPTSGLFAGEGHIPLACTPDSVGAAPITGALDECEVTHLHSNEVTRIYETPRVTKPYAEEDWQNIFRLGEAVDRQLQASDVRLTMGGEPTFVSIDDLNSPEWNTEALGKDKKERAEVLLRRLWLRWAHGGVLYHGMGKWYPGEPLPRWALGCFWRRDGHAIWAHPQWLANPDRPSGATEKDALQFVGQLATRLGVAKQFAVPAFEDGLYYLWKEGTLPENTDILDAKLRDPMERTRLRRLFEQGLDQTIGYALPIAWDEGQQQWVSSPWKFRRQHMFLSPGDSPMGFRLPLDSLLWEPKEKRQKLIPVDPFAPKAVLPRDFGEVHARYLKASEVASDSADLQEQGYADVPDDESEGKEALVRTAICIEPRDGTLYVFLPPLMELQHWLELIAVIEATAAELQIPIALEGYKPPQDERLRRLMVTPDPGVIEVNVPHVSSWAEMVEQTEALYEEARASRLATEKFLLDGRHTGTGGGNHVTLGGANVADSPLLRRPQLVMSLLNFWQHHPSLSYLFSGLFVGPTSQSPRVDEARDDALYELGIAFSQLPKGDDDRPWLVDRALRNLLVDVTGNTHRAEFCIDKLYSPDSPTGRLGILEFRAFEMPPHRRMSLVQMLLLRTLVARFWNEPYDKPLVSWGTELHDRFMLPHFVETDIADICAQLQSWGFDFDKSWLDPFMEFRFPHHGSVQIGEVALELRFAIEPWHVLGEEVTSQGTARFVDSAVERMQVKVKGMTENRHQLLCNGRLVPLRRTAVKDEYVAGVRYKAWQPPSGLHPTIKVQAPLIFDLVDTWSDHSLGGCTYHVGHPSGRNYEVLPVNAFEAEARRLARFWQYGHTPGKVKVQPEQPAKEHPYTLDLRRSPNEY